MNLVNPITITPPSFKRANGSLRTFNPITINELDITIIDNVNRKSAVAQIRPCPRPLVLWEGAAYDAIGDYTQAQVEAKITELLGSDPTKVLEGLFVPPAPVVPTTTTTTTTTVAPGA
jgi:hypothetical protein